MNKNFKKEILKKIESKNIEPKPKWQFLLKNYTLWSVGYLAVVFGGLFASIIIFGLFNNDWFLDSNIFKYISLGWIILFGLFVFIADYNFKNTKYGYKYTLKQVVGISILISLLLGWLFYSIGLASATDKILEQKIPRYVGIENRKMQFLNQPEKGLLSGKIVPSPRSDVLILEDFGGNNWEIDVSDLTEIDFVILDNFEMVNILGEKTAEGKFEACIVRPWKIERGFLNQKFGFGGGRGMMQKELNERKFFEMRNKECWEENMDPLFPSINN